MATGKKKRTRPCFLSRVWTSGFSRRVSMRNRVTLKTLVLLIFAVSLVAPKAKFAHASPQSASTKDVDLTNPDVAAIVKIAKDFSDAIAVGDFKRVIDFYSPNVIYMS